MSKPASQQEEESQSEDEASEEEEDDMSLEEGDDSGDNEDDGVDSEDDEDDDDDDDDDDDADDDDDEDGDVEKDKSGKMYINTFICNSVIALILPAVFICSSKENCEEKFAIRCERGQNGFYQVCDSLQYSALHCQTVCFPHVIAPFSLDLIKWNFCIFNSWYCRKDCRQ